MTKRALSVGAVLVALLGSALAQTREAAQTTPAASISLNQASPSDLVEGPVELPHTGSVRAVNNAWYGPGALTLDARLFSFPSAFGWVQGTPGTLLPVFSARPLPRLVAPVELGIDQSPIFGLEPQGTYATGEVSLFYGKSTGGKYSREVKAAHLLGEITNGNTHITVGAAYEESNGRRPVLLGH